ncbi:MAG: YfhO family protein, partial [Anaerolineales bacterium]
ASRLALQLLTISRALALAGVGLFISAVLSLLKPVSRPHAHTPTQPHTWELALVLFLSADLLLADYGLNPGAAPDLYRKPTASGATLAPAMDGHRLFQFPDDEYHVRYERLFSFQNFGPPGLAQAAREAQLPNTALLDGLASSNNFEPLVSARYAGLLEVVSATRSLNLLRLMDVSVVASSATLDWERVASGMEGVHFYRLPGQPRRVWVVYSDQTIADAAAARAALAAPDFDPGTTVILEADDPGAFPYAAPFPSTSLTASPNAVTIPVSLDRPGWVVLSDTYYPGWAAFVDGQPARLLHADYAFRAVAVGQGEHVLEFRYQPRSFQIGLWISGLSWLAWLGAAMWAWRRSC